MHSLMEIMRCIQKIAFIYQVVLIENTWEIFQIVKMQLRKQRKPILKQTDAKPVQIAVIQAKFKQWDSDFKKE